MAMESIQPEQILGTEQETANGTTGAGQGTPDAPPRTRGSGNRRGGVQIRVSELELRVEQQEAKIKEMQAELDRLRDAQRAIALAKRWREENANPDPEAEEEWRQLEELLGPMLSAGRVQNLSDLSHFSGTRR